MKSSSRSRAAKAAALHWVTYFGHIHGYLPETIAEADEPALEDIVRVQCGRDAERACALIERIVDAPVYGCSLEIRYTAFLCWIEARMPKRARFYGSAAMAEMRALIAQNVEAA